MPASKSALALYSVGLRKCYRCKQIKTLDQFSKHSANKTFGLQGMCKSCCTEDKKERRHKNPEHDRRSSKAYRDRHIDEVRKRDRARNFRRKYGISIADRKQMYVDQQGRCKLCQDFVPYSDMKTDHSHINGRVRGLLCQNCNFWLGQLEANRNKLHASLEYIDGA